MRGETLASSAAQRELQVLDAACRHLQLARTDIEVLRCVGSLALALGARRAERGSIKALHAVLLQRVQPGMSNVEAWTSTGASMSSFAKWRRRVHTSGPVAPLLGSGWRTQSVVVPLSWTEVARQWHAKNPGWGCSAVVQTAPTAATVQLAVEALADMATEEGAAVAHQSVAAQRPASVELHQGTKRQRQTGSCSPAEVPALKGTQRIEEGPETPQNQDPHHTLLPSAVVVAPPNAVPVHQCGTYLLVASPCNSISIPHLTGFGTDTIALQELFARLFTPNPPSELHKSQWVSFTQLTEAVRAYAPGQVWSKGPGNLKQLVIQWYRDHPVFAGLEVNAWCKQLPDFDAPGHTVSKFCFAYTPKLLSSGVRWPQHRGPAHQHPVWGRWN